MTDQKRLAELQSAIDRAAQLYYTPGLRSPHTDQEYDAMLTDLRVLNPGDPRLDRVGPSYTREELATKTPHTIPMGSLNNTDQGISGFAAWYSNLCDTLGVQACAINASLKMDGASIALNYENGVLVRAVTRGNGVVGEDITANAVLWRGVPTALPRPITATIRGECMLYHDDFKKVAEVQRREAAGEPLGNPRNMGNGIMGREDGLENDLLQLVAFNFVPENELEDDTLSNRFKILGALGFNPVQHKVFDGTRQQVIEQVEAWAASVAQMRDSLPFDIDGIVVFVDSIDLQKRLIRDPVKDQLRPRYGRAVKWDTKYGITKATGITITIGHTGAIVPTLDVEPVNIGGVIVDSALLNNWNEYSEYPSAAHVAAGDTVRIDRQGDVIPKLTEVVDPIYKCPKCSFVGTLNEQVEHHKSPA